MAPNQYKSLAKSMDEGELVATTKLVEEKNIELCPRFRNDIFLSPLDVRSAALRHLSAEIRALMA